MNNFLRVHQLIERSASLRFSIFSKKILLIILFVFLLVSHNSLFGQTYSLQKNGGKILAWNGIPQRNESWGDNLVYLITNKTDGQRKMGALGGIPLATIYNEDGDGIAVFNTALYLESFIVTIKHNKTNVTISGSHASNIEVYQFSNGDYYEALRHFALIMQEKGLSTQPAPISAYDPIWETYGYEENWSPSIVDSLMSTMSSFGIKTITLDAGWAGSGSGNNWNTENGDHPVNTSIIGDYNGTSGANEQDLKDFITNMHNNGFKVRLWWKPGLISPGTNAADIHEETKISNEIVSWNSETTNSWYPDPRLDEIQKWNEDIIERFIAYGADGFKQDDIYQINTTNSGIHSEYNKQINSNLIISKKLKDDFVINTCNCGIAQNFYDFSGQNQLITADPVSANQFRHRAKYLHALNVNGAAILGDHIELTEGDVGASDLQQAGFYDKPDFASSVALGMVLQSKFRTNPGAKYKKWFNIYNTYKFYNMEWINIPLMLSTTEPESYLMKNGNDLYPSFFMQDIVKDDMVIGYRSYSGNVTISHLEPGSEYLLYNISSGTDLGIFKASGKKHSIYVNFTRSIVFKVLKLENIR